MKRELKHGPDESGDALDVVNQMDMAKSHQVPPNLKDILSPVSLSSSRETFFRETVNWEELTVPILLSDLQCMLQEEGTLPAHRSCIQNLSSWIGEVSSTSRKLSLAISEIRSMMESLVERVDQSVTGLSLLMSSAKFNIGSEPDVEDNGIGSSIWSSLLHLDETIKQISRAQEKEIHENKQMVNEHALDINELFEYVKSLNSKFSKDIKYLHKLVLEAKSRQANAHRSLSNQSIPQFESIISTTPVTHNTIEVSSSLNSNVIQEHKNTIAILNRRLEDLESKVANIAAPAVDESMYTQLSS